MGLTSNDHLNVLFITQAKELFRVPEVYLALETREIPDRVKRHDVGVLFESPHELRRWDVRIHHGEVTVERFKFHAPPKEEEPIAEPSDEVKKYSSRLQERYIILTITRKDRVMPMKQNFDFREGDIAAMAIYIPEQEEARRILNEQGWENLDTPSKQTEDRLQQTVS